jgi:hypothetical protein
LAAQLLLEKVMHFQEGCGPYLLGGKPPTIARVARPIQVLQMQHLQGIHMYGEGSDARQTARSASVTRRERWRRSCCLKKLCLFRRGVVHIMCIYIYKFIYVDI